MARIGTTDILETARQALFEWPVSKRLALVCGLIAFEFGLYLLVNLFFLFFGSDSFVDRGVLVQTIPWNIATVVVYLLLSAICATQLDETKKYYLLQLILLLAYAFLLLCIDNLIGKGTTFDGVNYLGGAVIGMILLSRWVVYLAVIASQVISYTLFYLVVEGVLPFAPLRLSSVLTPEHMDWVLIVDAMSLPKIWVLIILIDLMVTTLRREQQKVKFLSERDPLTGLFNRLSLRERLIHSVASNHNMCVLLLDVDHFKRINDQFGHPVGDRVLVKLADTVLTTLRPNDVCWRYGGEEFLILLEDLTHREGISVAKRIRSEIADMQIEHNGQRIPVNVSIGLASMRRESAERSKIDQGDLVRKLVKTADDMLYRSKTGGRNQVTGAQVDTQFEMEQVDSDH